MKRLPVLAIGGLTALLVIVWSMPYLAASLEGGRMPSRMPNTSSAGATPIPSNGQVRGADGSERRDVQVLVDRILARPLFNADRRPAASGPVPGGTGLPRLTAVLVSSRGKTAIFDGGPDGKPVVLAEGGRIGGYVVRSIGAGQVTVSGPGGTQSIRPTPDEARQAAVPGIAARPSMLDLLRQRAAQTDAPGLPTAATR